MRNSVPNDNTDHVLFATKAAVVTVLASLAVFVLVGVFTVTPAQTSAQPAGLLSGFVGINNNDKQDFENVQNASASAGDKQSLSPALATAVAPSANSSADISNTTTKILAVGDMMFDRGVERQIVDHGNGSFDWPFMYVANEFNTYDVVFGNLEGPVSDKGSDVGGKYSFRFDPAVVPAMQAAGVDVVSLANNHAYDWGPQALCDSIDRLDDANITVVGAGCDEAEANRVYIQNVNGVSIAWLAYTNLYPSGLIATDDRAGVNDFKLDEVLADVAKIKQGKLADLIFVSVHWGEEYQSLPTKTMQSQAYQLIDSGVDVLLGHHPHVAQPIERYADGWIFYSLGNFIFDQYFSEETMQGLTAEIIIEDGAIATVNPRTVKLTQYYQPQFVE